VGNKLYTLCDILSSRKWTDEDIIEDLKFITTELQYHIQKLTNFDEYASEVRSGRLDWSPTHTSESFWKQNAQKLNEKDHELLRYVLI
jgi:V-type H+-transporting ATPase subunit H